MENLEIFYFESKSYVGMFHIPQINKFFGMIPRLKHYNNIINFLLTLGIQLGNYLTISFLKDIKMH